MLLIEAVLQRCILQILGGRTSAGIGIAKQLPVNFPIWFRTGPFLFNRLQSALGQSMFPGGRVLDKPSDFVDPASMFWLHVINKRKESREEFEYLYQERTIFVS